MQRMMEQRHLTELESRNLIEAQMPLEVKEAKADFVIENSGHLNYTKSQVDDVLRLLNASKFHWKIRLLIGVAVGGIVGFGYVISSLFRR